MHLIPIARLNAVLAISSQAHYLHDLSGWVDRLDRAQPSSDRRIYVYYVQNGRATDLASVLGKVLGTPSGKDSGPQSAPSSLNDPNLASSLSPVSGLQPQPNGIPQPPAASSNPTGAIEAPQHDSAGSNGDSGLVNGLRVTADETTNSLLIYGTPSEYSIIENALSKLDIAPQQVLIEAAVAEVTLTNDLQFGVQYYFKSGSSHQVILSNGTSATLNATFPGFAYLFSSGSDIQAVLNALENITTVDVVSAPEILVLNNQTAQLQVGNQVPIATQSAVSVTTAGAPVVNNIEYKDTGVILKVTPRVNEGGLVLMDIAQEVSDVSQTTTSSLDSPTIEERKISSNIAVQDGETVALGGLITNSITRSRAGIPLLQDIPYVGALFGTTTRNATRTELIVLLTPHVVQGIQKLRDVTEELRRKMPATRPLL